MPSRYFTYSEIFIASLLSYFTVNELQYTYAERLRNFAVGHIGGQLVVTRATRPRYWHFTFSRFWGFHASGFEKFSFRHRAMAGLERVRAIMPY